MKVEIYPKDRSIMFFTETDFESEAMWAILHDDKLSPNKLEVSMSSNAILIKSISKKKTNKQKVGDLL